MICRQTFSAWAYLPCLNKVLAISIALPGVTLTRPCWALAIASPTEMSGAGALVCLGAVRPDFRLAGMVLVLLMVLNSRQNSLDPKKKEEGIASLFSFLVRPDLGLGPSLLSPVPAPAEAAA